MLIILRYGDRWIAADHRDANNRNWNGWAMINLVNGSVLVVTPNE